LFSVCHETRGMVSDILNMWYILHLFQKSYLITVLWWTIYVMLSVMLCNCRILYSYSVYCSCINNSILSTNRYNLKFPNF
jgi:hypothetical protein